MNNAHRTTLMVMIGGTLAGFTLLAFLVHHLAAGTPFVTILNPVAPLSVQIPLGLAVGSFAAALITLALLNIPYFQPLRTFTEEIIRYLSPSLITIILIALAAGWGEELFFRGVLQPLTGNGIASFLFSGIHIRFDFRTRMNRQYFFLLFPVSLGLGMISNRSGLYAAMSAHAAWDFTVLMIARRLTPAAPETRFIPGPENNTAPPRISSE